MQRGRSQPPSVQVAGILRARIQSGDIAPGQQLPPIVALSTEFGVTSNTVQKALRILKDEGLVVAVPGYGTFAAELTHDPVVAASGPRSRSGRPIPAQHLR